MAKIRDYYTIPKKDLYETQGKFSMVGSKTPVEIRLPEGFSVNDYMIPWDADFDQEDDSCKHSWKNYIGFDWSFKYCTKCDIKEDLDE